MATVEKIQEDMARVERVAIPTGKKDKEGNEITRRFYKRAAEPQSMLRPSFSTSTECWVPVGLQMFLRNNSKEKTEKRLEETGRIGTAGHTAIEKYNSGEEYEDTEQNRSFIKRWAGLIEEYDIVPLKHEVMVVSDRFGYGGQLDAVVEMTDNKGNRKRYIVDYKTGFVGPKAAFQVAAYAEAYEEEHGGEHGIAVFQIHRDGRPPKAIFYHDRNFWFGGFIGILNAWKIENYRELKKFGWIWLDKDLLTEFVKGTS